VVLEVLTTEDRNNILLKRREIKIILKNAAGRVKRIEAAEALAKQLNVEKQTVIPIEMKCETGKTDVYATFYVYNDDEDAKKQLPRFRLLRNIPKADRKKLIDEQKAEKLKAKQAAAAESKTSIGRRRN
jgi:small subunit ribosomal protein S24e